MAAAAARPIPAPARRGRQPPGAQAPQTAARAGRAPAPAPSRARRISPLRHAAAPSRHTGWRGRRRPAASSAPPPCHGQRGVASEGARLTTPRPPMQTAAIRSPASMPPSVLGAAIDERLASSAAASRRCAARLHPRPCGRRAPGERVEAESAHQPAPKAAAIASPRSSTSRRASAAIAASRKHGAERRAGARPRVPAAGGRPSSRASRAPARIAHRAPRIDDARRGRAGEDSATAVREPAAARLDMQREQAALGRPENVERRARPRIDLDQMPARRRRRGNRRCSARPGPPPRQSAGQPRPSASASISRAAVGGPHRAAIAEWSVG